MTIFVDTEFLQRVQDIARHALYIVGCVVEDIQRIAFDLLIDFRRPGAEELHVGGFELFGEIVEASHGRPRRGVELVKAPFHLCQDSGIICRLELVRKLAPLQRSLRVRRLVVDET
ncbi:hypothetical protein D9M69_594460 [compost metagenome]